MIFKLLKLLMAEFTIYNILMDNPLQDVGDAVVAADKKRAFSLFEQEIERHLTSIGLNMSNSKLRLKCEMEETGYTTDKEGVIYARTTARNNF